MLGRDAELALLTSLLDGVRDAGTALVIGGEPGIEIARLAAEGPSNRQIGQRLYLSHLTVGTHLYRGSARPGR